MDSKLQQEREVNGGTPFAEARGSATEIIEELIRACGSGMNWMEQVSRAKIGSATRGILTTDMGMCSSAIFKARLYLEKAKSPNDQAEAQPPKTNE
jgi:hypothetical protein